MLTRSMSRLHTGMSASRAGPHRQTNVAFSLRSRLIVIARAFILLGPYLPHVTFQNKNFLTSVNRRFQKNIKNFQIGSLAHDNLCGNDHHAATPTRNPDCRALPTHIVALYPARTRHPLPRFSQHTREKKKRRIPRRQIKEEMMTENEGNVVTEQPVAEPEAPAPTELQAAQQSA